MIILENIITCDNIIQYYIEDEKFVQYYTLDIKISLNIFFGPLLMELH